MAQKTPVVMSDNKDQHVPLSVGDTIRVTDIPISAADGNTLQRRADGLYNGTEAPPDYRNQYVDNVNGNDSTGDGTQAKPYKTINRALNNMIPGTSGYTVYLHDNQTHVLPSRSLTDVSLKFASYPSFQNNAALLNEIREAWYEKYNGLATANTFATAFDRATIIPDRVNPLDTTSPGGPYGSMTGLVTNGGSIEYNNVKIICGPRSMDVPVSGMNRAAFLCDFDLRGPATYLINYCDVELGSLPFVVQRGSGSEVTVNVYASSIIGTPDTEGTPVYMKGWGSDAPKVNMMVGGENDGTQFVTVDGVDYHVRNTKGSVAAAKQYTTGVVYYNNEIPTTVNAAFLYGGSAITMKAAVAKTRAKKS